MNYRSALVLALGVLALWPSVHGQPIGPLGGEFQVPGKATGTQRTPVVAVGPGGHFLVVWEDATRDEGTRGIFGRRHAFTGEPLAEDFPVNTHSSGDQILPAVTAAENGVFLVVWESAGQDGDGGGVFLRRFASDGSPLGDDQQVNTFTSGRQGAPDIAAAPGGRFVVVWQSEDQDGEAEGIFAQRFAADGTPVGTEFQVNSYTPNGQLDPAVAMGDAGQFVVAWHHPLYPFPDYGDTRGIRLRRFSSSGAAQGPEIEVTSTNQWPERDAAPDVAMSPAGEFVVVWNDFIYLEGPGVAWQRFDRFGAPQGSAVRPLLSYGGRAAVSRARSGEFVVVWRSGFNLPTLYGRAYSAAGSPEGPIFQVTQSTSYSDHDRNPVLAHRPGSRDFVVTWERGLGQDLDVYARRFGTGIVFADGFESGDTSSWAGTVP